MRLYRCPSCRSYPMVVDVSGGVMAVCECTSVRAKDRASLRHRWNDLYCSNDPATVEDDE